MTADTLKLLIITIGVVVTVIGAMLIGTFAARSERDHKAYIKFLEMRAAGRIGEDPPVPPTLSFPDRSKAARDASMARHPANRTRDVMPDPKLVERPSRPLTDWPEG